MPGNEVGDRVHNFFAQENLSQEQHNSQALDGNWPLLNNNLWTGGQRPVGVVSSNAKSYNLQQSDIERGHIGNPSHGPHGLSFTQSDPRPEFVKSQPQNQRANFNGFMYGNQFYQTRQDDANFLAVDTNLDQQNLTSRGISTYGSQQASGPENQTKAAVRSEGSGSPVSFDFFGGQQQMNHQQLSMLQSLQRQHSGLNDMQQLQQQFMFMKMQELQRQQQMQQVDARRQNMINQIPPFAKQASSSHSLAMMNGSLNSDALGYHWATNELGNANWLQRNSPAIQGSSNGLVFSPNHSQTHCVVDLVPQQVEQSLYGVPVSSSRGSLNQYPYTTTDKPSVQQMDTFGNSVPGNQFNVYPGQINAHDGILVAKQRFQSENSFGHASGQALTSVNMENLHQVNSMQRNAPMQEFRGRQELDVRPETSRNDVALDPTEERILFGSDDNIWSAFGKSENIGGEGSNTLDGAGVNGFPSIQSGTWSALMQSAVAETSSGGMGLQEEWSGLNFQTNEISKRNQQALASNDGGKQPTHLADDSLSMISSFGSGTVPPPNEINMNKNYQNVLGFQQFGGKFSSESDQRLQAPSSQGLNQYSEGGRSTNGIPGRKLVAEGSQMHGNTSHSLDTENVKDISSSWMPENSGSRQLSNKPNGWNVFASVTPHGDTAFTVHGSGHSSHYSQGNDLKQVMHREALHSGTLSKPNSVNDSTAEMEQMKFSAGSSQVNKEGFSAAVLQNPNTMRSGEGSSQFLVSSNQLNYWKNVDPVVKSKVSEMIGRSQHDSKNCSSKEVGLGHEMENSDKQENSNDSYRSNLSHHTSAAGPRENPMSDASDSRTMSTGKQKPSNQISRKNSTPHKFQYHPMGNLVDNQEPPYGMKQPVHSQTMSHINHSKFPGQAARNSVETGKAQSPDLQRSAKGFQEGLSQGTFPGSLANMSAPLNRSDIHLSNKAFPQSSQNMLELLHKVDQSREHGAMHVSASEPNASSEMPQADNSEGPVGRLQRSQSSNSQGFGLQLGPPSQRIPIPNHSLPSQSSLQMVSSLHSSCSAEHGQRGPPQLAPTSFVQSTPSSIETSQGELKIERSGVLGQMGNGASLHKMPGNFSSAINPGFPYSRGQLQNQEMTLAGKQVSGSFEKHASDSTQKEATHSRPPTSQSTETSLPDEAASTTNVNNVLFGNASQQFCMNNVPEKVSAPHTLSGEPVPISQPSTVTGLSLQGSSKLIPNMWTNIAAQQHLFGAQFHKVPSQLPQSYHTNMNSTSYASLNQGDQEAKQGGNFLSGFGASSVNAQCLGFEEEQSVKKHNVHQVSSENINLAQKMSESQGNDPTTRTLSYGTPANSASTQRDIEDFGRSLKPNNIFQHNYALLNQISAMKNAENDPSHRVLKRMKGPDSGLSSPLVAPKVGQLNDQTASAGDVLVSSHTTSPSGDSTLLSFSEPANNTERNASSDHGNVASQGALAFGIDVSQSINNTTGSKVDHSKISPQMAPSWFDQYGTFKNGHILPMYDARRAVTPRTGEQPFTLGKSSSGLHALNSMEQLTAATVDTNQGGSILQSATPSSVTMEHFSSQILPTNISGQQPVKLRTKKRKSATSELIPWHKEVSEGSRDLQTISTAEVEWAKAANRLAEKVEEDVDFMEDGPHILRPKRRLILTTQLMQQLLRSPPAGILSTDANSDYESVAYSVSRLALGDAYCAVSLANNKTSTSHGCVNGTSDERKPLERVDDQNLSKLIQEFTARAKKLENDFLRMDKRASVLDLIIDCQDLEKFSVINRFAKFHGRGQADSVDTASSSDPAMNSQKPCLQRYVTALPLPRSLPTRLQCHSL